MNLYYVEIYGKEGGRFSHLGALRLHGELVMTDSFESADEVAWEHLLVDMHPTLRAITTRDDVEIMNELITDVTVLGGDRAVYETADAVRSESSD